MFPLRSKPSHQALVVYHAAASDGPELWPSPPGSWRRSMPALKKRMAERRETGVATPDPGRRPDDR